MKPLLFLELLTTIGRLTVREYPRKLGIFAFKTISDTDIWNSDDGVPHLESIILAFFLVALRPNLGHDLLILEVSGSHTTTHYSR